MSSPARAASIQARLRRGAQERGEDFNLTLGRYAVERFLYRLSVSEAKDMFVLKGALLFGLWFRAPHRPTRDADFLGLGNPDAEALTRSMRGVCAIPADDGMVYDPETVTTSVIREDVSYGGLRVKLRGRLGKADSAVQLDVGFGDAITPAAREVELPRLLDDQPAARLRVYPRETVVAEKLEAIVKLGLFNSRLKDYYDLNALRLENKINERDLANAIAATFRRRGTPIPDAPPEGLTEAFAGDPQKRAMWAGFLRKNRVDSPPLETVVASLAGWLGLSLRKAHTKRAQST